MDYRQALAFPDREFISQTAFDALFNNPRTLLPAIITILVCFAFAFVARWPPSIERKLWEMLVYLTPSPFLYSVDFLSRRKQQNGCGEMGFSRADFGDQRAKSDALQRILRLNHDSTTAVVQSARRLSGLDKVLRPADFVPAGLGNWDNSCYQNSVLQALASLSSFDNYLARNVEDMSSQDVGSTHRALIEIIGRLNKLENEGKRLWTPSVLKSMNSWQQQDAQEYFSKIMDETDSEISKSVRSRNAQLGFGREIDDRKAPHTGQPNPFQGLLAQRVGCKTCRYTEGLSLLPFTCLTVNLGSQHEYDIQQCLDGYTALESIEGVECIKCTVLRMEASLEQILMRTEVDEAPTSPAQSDSLPLCSLRRTVTERLQAIAGVCKSGDFSDSRLYKKCMIPAKSRVSSTKSKQAVVARAPDNLVIHINRSMFDLTGLQRKNHARVSFPLDLDLSRWCLGSKYLKIGQESLESWTTDPVVSMLPKPEAPPSAIDRVYRLRAVITHYGGHENGHYIAYRKRRRTFQKLDTATWNPEGPGDSWYRFSDDTVSAVSEENVLAQGGVFMLFYEATGCKANDNHSAATESVDEPLLAVDDEQPTITTIAEEERIPLREPQAAERGLEPSTARSAARARMQSEPEPEPIERQDITTPFDRPSSSQASDDASDPATQPETARLMSVAPAMRTAGALSPDSRNESRPNNISMHSPSFVTAS